MTSDECWHALPVDDVVSSELIECLKASDFTLDLLRQIPVDGPYAPEQLRELAVTGFGPAAEFARQLSIDEPLSPEALVEFARIGLDDALDRILAAQTDGPLSLRKALAAARTPATN